MMTSDEIFFDSDKRVALCCDDIDDTNDLAILAENIIEKNIKLISVPPKVLPFMWTCLEKNDVKILTRYFFESLNKNADDVSELSANIVSVYKQGANGVQIFTKLRGLENFVDLGSLVREDLFFEHDLSIFLNIQEISVNEWEIVFGNLREIRADSFGLVFNEDVGNRSDFIGRIYGMLDKWDFDGNLHFMFGNNFERIDQTVRLVESMRPELSDRLRFFLEY